MIAAPETPSQGVFLRPDQVAMLLDIDVQTVRRLLKTGEIPGFKVGGVWRVARAELDRMAATGPGAFEP